MLNQIDSCLNQIGSTLNLFDSIWTRTSVTIEIIEIVEKET